MRHVSAIKKIVDQGKFEEAHRALDELLELGPHNSEALKLKAALYEHVGRFEEEWLVWRRVLESDIEDEDAIDFFQRSQMEEREHYYFSDPLPGGGRRFLAYPRTLVTVSFIGLLGCVCFLYLTRTGSVEFTQSPSMLFSAFAALVLGPWFAIIYLYIRTLRCIDITSSGLEISTRFRNFHYPWQKISRIYIAHSDDLDTSELRLIVVPNEPQHPPLSIDFSEKNSAVRARRHLVQEIRDHFHEVHHAALSALHVDRKKTRHF